MCRVVAMLRGPQDRKARDLSRAYFNAAFGEHRHVENLALYLLKNLQFFANSEFPALWPRGLKLSIRLWSPTSTGSSLGNGERNQS